MSAYHASSFSYLLKMKFVAVLLLVSMAAFAVGQDLPPLSFAGFPAPAGYVAEGGMAAPLPMLQATDNGPCDYEDLVEWIGNPKFCTGVYICK